MDQTICLNDNNCIPALGLGTYKITDSEMTKVFREAMECGYRLIDTASFYQNERGLGQALKNCELPREKIFITTKLWNDDQGYKNTFKALEKSLIELQLDYVDLYLIHWPSPLRELFVETWQALIDLKKQGKIKSIGVSNFAIPHLKKIVDETGVVPAINQIELHPFFAQKELRAFHEQLNIKTQSWGPLGRGKSLQNPILLELAFKHHKTPAQIVLRWHVQNGLIAIPKSITPSRIKENSQIFDFVLDKDDFFALDKLDSKFGRTGPNPYQMDF